MITQNIDIWVSDGGFDSPFYKFYSDFDGSNELRELVFSSKKQYTFRRLNQASSHPFYIRQSDSGGSSMQLLKFSGNGTINSGIVGEEFFTLQALNPDLESINVEYFCTSHPSMQGQMVFRRDSVPLIPTAASDSEISAIGRLYTAAFGRKPDANGLQFWVDVISDPVVSYKDVSKSFVDSSEFSIIAAPDSSSEFFATALYQNVLGRAPDPSGLVYWINQLDSGLQDRADVLIEFANSSENVFLHETLA